MNDPKIETVEFSDGAKVTNKIYQLSDGVQLKVHSEQEGVLTINDGYLEFEWNSVTEHAFHSLETITASEIFATISENPI